jgi:hypothetical protein
MITAQEAQAQVLEVIAARLEGEIDEEPSTAAVKTKIETAVTTAISEELLSTALDLTEVEIGLFKSAPFSEWLTALSYTFSITPVFNVAVDPPTANGGVLTISWYGSAYGRSPSA